MVNKRTVSTFILASILSLTSFSASAIEITFSDKTKSSAPIFKFSAESNLPMNLGFQGKVEFSHSYSSIVGDYKGSNGAERWSLMGNAEANLLYNWVLLNAKTIIGDFNPTISPYVGYKQFGSQYAVGGLAIDKLEPTLSLSTIGGVNYGLRFTSSLPLGFFVYADTGMTSVLNNGLWFQFKPDSNSGFSGGGVTLPHAGIGASFDFLNLFKLKAGYNFFYLPDLRTNGTALSDSSKAMVQSLDLGVSILFFSI